MSVRVLIVDDHPVVRDGLRGMLAAEPDLEVVGEAGDGRAALAVLDQVAVDVVLLDLRMPGMGGLELLHALHERATALAVIVLTTYDTDDDVAAALAAGATGYLLKDAPRADLVNAVRAAARGQAALAPSVAIRLVARLNRPALALPSAREMEVLRLVARGCTNAEAAHRLGIGEATVKTHLVHVYDKLGVGDRAAAVATAYDRGLISPSP